MKPTKTALDLHEFFPVALEIYDIVSDENQITIYMKSKSKECICPACGTISQKHHGTYHRRVQDLPIFGKSVWLDITAYEHQCENSGCLNVSNVETFQGFLRYRRRMTDRCAFFICVLALETSCEATADICKAMGVQVSGDTVIRMLLSRAQDCPAEVVGDLVGVDDFANKKGCTYCTVLVNGESHRIIDILEGRDSDTLKAWLQENRHVHRFTRDCASSYAKAIAEVLPNAMQIADRFHLHQNLLDCIKSILNSELPARIKIPKETAEPEQQIPLPRESESKKNMEPCKPRESERNRRVLYQSIQDMLDAHYSHRQIAKALKVSRNTIAKIACGNIENLCQSSYQSIWDSFSDEMLDGIRTGKTGKEIYIELVKHHKTIGKMTSFYKYIAQLAEDAGLKLERYHHQSMPLPDGTIPQKDFDCIKRNGVLQYLWNGLEISHSHLDYLYRNYPIIPILRKRILEFREIFRWKNPYLLFLFIDNCKEGDNVKLSRFE